jgi:alkylhydroperoxidase/carboxymuconolactone decarboxylase family protein YurZ
LEFIHITVNASVTHPYEPALRVHIANALRCGAAKAEILEVFQLVSILGIHSMGLSMPILLEEAKAAGQEVDLTKLSTEQSELKRQFTETRGYWPQTWDGIVALAPDYMKAHDRLGSTAQVGGLIEPKVKQLILIAVDASTTHLWASGVRTHIRAALKEGASIKEIVEVLKLVSTLGVQSVTFGLPILLGEALTGDAG